ncbi:MAG: hypothetical protein KGL96_15225, partial [Hyphomicrobiales bacterium]|nr:hypothetical protein [Hyphomicrobiales bacterium]
MADRSGLYESSRSTNTSPRYSSQVSPARTSNYSGAFSETRGSTAPSYTAPAPQPQNASYVRGANEIRGTDIIAEYLIKEKVPYILGYAGHGAIGLL